MCCPSTRKPCRRFTGHDDGITGLAFTIDDKALASSRGDCTILIWDVSAKTVAKTAPDGNLDQDWQVLRGEDAQKAFAAIRKLAANPETALKIASNHLKPAEPIDPQWAAARLRDLDHPKFAEREPATRELEEVGDRAAAALEKFLATTPSAESRERAEKILAKIRGRDAADHVAQSLRALEVLEWIGTARARELVENLAIGKFLPLAASGRSQTSTSAPRVRRQPHWLQGMIAFGTAVTPLPEKVRVARVGHIDRRMELSRRVQAGLATIDDRQAPQMDRLNGV